MTSWWYTHSCTSLVVHGTVQGGRRRGRQKKHWENNVSEWTGLKFCNTLREAENKIKWRERVAMSMVPQWSPWLWDRCRCSSLKNHTQFQTKRGKVYVCFQTKRVKKTYPLNRHMSIGLYKGVPLPLGESCHKELMGLLMTLTDIGTTFPNASHCHSKLVLICQQMVTPAQVFKMLTYCQQQSRSGLH